MRKTFLLLVCSFMSLNAMTLQESISYALKHNNNLKQADVSTERLQAVRDSKKAKNFGRVDLLSSYDHYNNARTLAPLTPMSIVGSPDGAYKIPTTKDMISVGVAYNVTLFDGFAQQNIYKISDLQYQNAAIKSHLGKEELIYNVRNLYISLLALEEQLNAQNLYTEAQQRLLDRIKEEKALGSKSKLDELRAQNSVEESRTKAVTMEANIDILKASLSALMGGKEFDKTSPMDIIIDKDSVVRYQDEDIISLDRYKAAQLNVKASQKKQEQVKSSYYPHIDFSAYYGQNFGPNDTTNTVPLQNSAPTAGTTLINEGDWNNADNWQVGVHLKWNILDFGQTSALNEEAKLGYMLAKLDEENVKIQLNKNIVTAKNKIKLAEAQYDNFRSQYMLLDETQKIEQVKYDNDALSLTDLLDTSAKKELMYAQMINAKYSYQKAKYYLDYLLENGEK
jgi:outer membrane protein TolC